MIALLISPFYVLVNFYIGWRMFQWMQSCHPVFHLTWLQICLTVLYILVATSPLTGFLIKKPRLLHRFLKNIGNYFLGIFCYVLLTLLFTDMVRFLLIRILHLYFLNNNLVLILTGTVVILFLLGICSYGIIRSKTLTAAAYELEISKQNCSSDSLKIILLADLHLGYNVGTAQTIKIVEKINRQKPDLICIAGDIFDNEYEALDSPEDLIAVLSSLKARYGVYACWGNHDIHEPILAGFTFANKKNIFEDKRMRDFLNKAGIVLLEDSYKLIQNSFYIAGRRDQERSKKLNEPRLLPEEFMKEMHTEKPVIILDHQPKDLLEFSRLGADLHLSGHTHNGQMFPANLITRLAWKNAYGALKIGNMTSIVTSGAGVWGPGIRIGTKSEICTITLHFPQS